MLTYTERIGPISIVGVSTTRAFGVEVSTLTRRLSASGPWTKTSATLTRAMPVKTKKKPARTKPKR